MIDISPYMQRLEWLKIDIAMRIDFAVNYEINVKPMVELINYSQRKIFEELGISHDRIGDNKKAGLSTGPT